MQQNLFCLHKLLDLGYLHDCKATELQEEERIRPTRRLFSNNQIIIFTKNNVGLHVCNLVLSLLLTRPFAWRMNLGSLQQFCGADAPSTDDNRQRLQPSGRRQLRCELHSLLVFQFQVSSHILSCRRSGRRLNPRSNECGCVETSGTRCCHGTRCYDDGTRGYGAELGSRLNAITVDAVRTTSRPAATAAAARTTNHLSDRIQRVVNVRVAFIYGRPLRSSLCIVRYVCLSWARMYCS